MIVLGVDPGTLRTGYGVVGWKNGHLYRLHYGVIKNKATASMPFRLQTIFTELTDIIDRYHPDEFAIESAFYGKNVQSALKIGYARGVSILAAVQHELPTIEYAPREIKRALVGNGAASKDQVAYMVRSILQLRKDEDLLHDVSDALAVAICHLNKIVSPYNTRDFSSWKSFIDAHPERVIKK
jgi:crossover junction endodeoxyribonuclease RuvC